MYDNLKKRIERSAAGSNTDNQYLRTCLDMIYELERVATPSKRDSGVWTDDHGAKGPEDDYSKNGLEDDYGEDELKRQSFSCQLEFEWPRIYKEY